MRFNIGLGAFAPLLILELTHNIALGANILILHPLYAGSHDLVLRIIGDLLVEKGHSVTQIRFTHTHTRQDTNTRVDVKTLDIDDSGYPCERYINRKGQFDLQNRDIQLGKIIWNRADSPFVLPMDVYCVTHVHCQMVLEDQEFLRQLNNSRFDLAIVDLIANECGLATARALGLPVITFWGFGWQGGEVTYTSAWNPPSLVPAFMSGLDRHMDFLQRSKNVFYYLGHNILEYWQASVADQYIEKNFPHLGTSAKLIHDVDLHLVHTNWYVDYPRLVAPNTKYVGGMHLAQAVQPLSPEFQKIVDASPNGIILFSLGYTGFTPKDVPKDVMNAFLYAFRRIKQTVIMRFEKDVLSNIPDNVVVVDWMPQRDLLASNRTVLFVSHCGMNGILESVYHRVPILGIPIFGDQPDNAARLVDRGLGLTLDRHNLDGEDVLQKINEIITDEKFRLQANRFSTMWREERYTGFQEAIYWIERLLKYGNLDHLKINDDDLSLMQYLCLDIVLFWTVSLVALLVLLRRIYKKRRSILVKRKTE